MTAASLLHAPPPGSAPSPTGADPDGRATRLMDRFRRTGSRDVFEVLVRLTAPDLRRRLQRRVRCAGDRLDPDELLQDAYVNIFRYPDRFDASRPEAFRVWATTIVDNTVRRHLRRARGPDIVLRSTEQLEQHADGHASAPEQEVIDGESRRSLGRAYSLLLGAYLHGFRHLSQREQFVLQMVEVRGLRYAEVGAALRIRPEAVKMVVFRARRRVLERMSRLLDHDG